MEDKISILKYGLSTIYIVIGFFTLISEGYLIAFMLFFLAATNYLFFAIISEFSNKFDKLANEISIMKSQLYKIGVKHCKSCGKKVENLAKSCPHCGCREFK